MGLTIHYGLKSTVQTDAEAKEVVRQMRELALDLPFESVSEIVDLSGDACDIDKRCQDDEWHWLLIQSMAYVDCPWNKKINRNVKPNRVIAFEANPGDGCEVANIGLVLYPAEIAWEYNPMQDQRYQEKGDSGWDKFALNRWDRVNRYVSPYNFKEMRQVKVSVKGWTWSSFCKTQYASNPTCGGLPNFLHCHITVVTWLDRIAKIAGIKVDLNDEGRYGRSRYSDDWEEARAAKREPTYHWHKGTYDSKVLIQDVGKMNEMVAAIGGALQALCEQNGQSVVAPITSFPDFEKLEFKGQNQKYLEPFLKCMEMMASEQRKLAAM